MTHNQIASTIRNHISDGLSGAIADEEISIEQLLDEIDLTRASLIVKNALTMKVDYKYFMQSLDSIPITCKSMSTSCGVYIPGDSIPSIEIPSILPIAGDRGIEFIGTNDMSTSFDIYYHPEDIRDHKVRMVTRRRPYVWVDLAVNPKGMLTVWFFNFGSYNPLKKIKFRGVLNSPMKAINGYSVNTTEYPAPADVQQEIINFLTSKYINYYRALNIQPTANTQTDISLTAPTAQNTQA